MIDCFFRQFALCEHTPARFLILLNMVKDGYLRKEGAARSTIYVKNTEGR